jgi:hypothetical protein
MRWYAEDYETKVEIRMQKYIELYEVRTLISRIRLQQPRIKGKKMDAKQF